MPITTSVELPSANPFLDMDIPWLLRRRAEDYPRTLLNKGAKAEPRKLLQAETKA